MTVYAFSSGPLERKKSTEMVMCPSFDGAPAVRFRTRISRLGASALSCKTNLKDVLVTMTLICKEKV